MTDPRVGEIEARLEPALFHAPYIVDGRRVVQANNHPAIAPYMLSDNSMPVIADFIAHAPADVAYLLAELRKAHEALARVESLADEWEAGYGPGTRKAEVFGPQKVSIEFAVKSIRAAVAAASGDGQ